MKIYIKMENTVIKFGNIEIQKQKMHWHTRPLSIKNVNLIKWKDFFFIRHKDTQKIRSLCNLIPKISAYGREFDGTKYTCFF